MELEQDPPNWREQADQSAQSKLSKKETKRQEVINGEGERLLYLQMSKSQKVKSEMIQKK